MAVTFHVEDEEGATPVAIEGSDGAWRFVVGGQPALADVKRVTPDTLSILVDGVSYRVRYLEAGGRMIVCVQGEYYDFEVLDERQKSMRDSHHGAPGPQGPGAAGQIRSRIPGKIVSVLAHPGTLVERGDKLMIIEAMKMENEIRAPASGVVARVLVAPGDTVETGALLLELEAAPDGK